MNWIRHFFVDMCDINLLILFLISSFLLLFRDAKSLKEKKLERESRLSKIMGYVYIALGTGLYVTSLIFKG